MTLSWFRSELHPRLMLGGADDAQQGEAQRVMITFMWRALERATRRSMRRRYHCEIWPLPRTSRLAHATSVRTVLLPALPAASRSRTMGRSEYAAHSDWTTTPRYGTRACAACAAAKQVATTSATASAARRASAPTPFS